jgi:hypothetical protein
MSGKPRAPATRAGGVPGVRSPVVIESWVPRRLGAALSVLASLFFVAILSDDFGLHWVSAIPRPLRYFTQVACLFSEAARAAIDYRAEGFSCEHRSFEELDVRAYFPIDHDSKENRFYRALHFYREDRTTLRALEDYVLARHNQDVRAGDTGAASALGILGGVRFSSVRVPVGAPGEPVEPYERKPLTAYPDGAIRHFYFTPASERARRCRELDTNARP